MNRPVMIYDSTLRDGPRPRGYPSRSRTRERSSGPGRPGGRLHRGRNPGSNPKDEEFFAGLRDLKLENARLAAFGSTRRRGVEADADPNCLALLRAETPIVAVFGKSSGYHVREILKTSPEENLAMIRDTVAFSRARAGRSSSTPSISSTARPRTKHMPSRPWRRPSRAAPTGLCSATPTAGPSRGRSRR